MAIKIQIIDTVLVITDTTSGKIIAEDPANKVYYISDSLINDNCLALTRYSGSVRGYVEFECILLSDSLDEDDVEYTVSSWQDFARLNLGK